MLHTSSHLPYALVHVHVPKVCASVGLGAKDDLSLRVSIETILSHYNHHRCALDSIQLSLRKQRTRQRIPYTWEVTCIVICPCLCGP